MTEMLLLAKRNLKFLKREIEYLKQETDEDYLISRNKATIYFKRV